MRQIETQQPQKHNAKQYTNTVHQQAKKPQQQYSKPAPKNKRRGGKKGRVSGLVYVVNKPDSVWKTPIKFESFHTSLTRHVQVAELVLAHDYLYDNYRHTLIPRTTPELELYCEKQEMDGVTCYVTNDDYQFENLATTLFDPNSVIYTDLELSHDKMS